MHRSLWLLGALSLTACGGTIEETASSAAQSSVTAVSFKDDMPFDAVALGTFAEPWAMEFMPDGRMLITQKTGELFIVDQQGKRSAPIENTPTIDYGGQGGLGDVVLHPDFQRNQTIYLSFAEAGDDDTRGAAVMRATLREAGDGGRLEDTEIIWRQYPKVTGRGHYGHRMVFSDDGYLFISSGERQKFDPSQDMSSNMGKIVRLNDDGSVPADNPFASEGGVTAQIWSLGHRNPLGIAFDADGNLWNSEMGPRHGDELNFVKAKNNYGYPLVSNGNHYNGNRIPDHDTRPDLDAPAAYWVPAISPGSLMIYTDDLFADWTGNAFLGALSGEAIVRVALDGEAAKEVARYRMGARIREVEQGPSGAIWVLEDGKKARLMKLTPKG